MGFSGITGTGEAKFLVYETGNAANADTIAFRYHATVAAGIAQNQNKAGVKLYPNPAKSFIQIVGINDLNNDILVSIYSMDGKAQLIHKQLMATNQGYDISSCPSGSYLLEGTQNGKTIYSTKFIKQ